MRLKWTTEPPTEPGWYWWREYPEPGALHMVKVARRPPYGRMVILLSATEVRPVSGRQAYEMQRGMHAQFAGPIPEPEG